MEKIIIPKARKNACGFLIDQISIFAQ